LRPVKIKKPQAEPWGEIDFFFFLLIQLKTKLILLRDAVPVVVQVDGPTVELFSKIFNFFNEM
jgi:hypothetical protein